MIRQGRLFNLINLKYPAKFLRYNKRRKPVKDFIAPVERVRANRQSWFHLPFVPQPVRRRKPVERRKKLSPDPCHLPLRVRLVFNREWLYF